LTFFSSVGRKEAVWYFFKTCLLWA